MIGVLLRPRLLTIKNRLRSNYSLKRQFGRDLVVVLFSIATIIGIYEGTTAGLRMILNNSRFVYLPPAQPLGMLFLTLLLLLLVSNAVSCLGVFYQSRDLELLMAAPIPPGYFFGAKFIEFCANSSWMVLIFAFPVIAAFGEVYHAPAVYYLAALALLLPYFLIPSALSLTVISVMGRLMSIERARQFMFTCALVCIVGVFLLIQMAAPRGHMSSLEQLLHIVSFISASNSDWLPSYWLAICLGGFLEPSEHSTAPYFILLIAAAAALVALAYLVVRLCHHSAFSQAMSSKGRVKTRSRSMQAAMSLLSPLIDRQYRALLAKEIKIFSRDITQALQLLLLLGLCMIYLYNFRLLHAVQSLPETTRAWWQAVLVFSNVGMGACVVTAICSRFVFPSLSMEGQAFWVLQSSPIGYARILRARFWCWFVPVAGMSTVLFISGALAIDAAPQILVVNAITSWVVCYGIVGLAVGLGALFANFEWEHVSQLAASFGSLIFMLSSFVLITLSLIPIGVLIFLRTVRNFGYNISFLQWYLSVLTCTFLLVYINHAVMRWALKAGENALCRSSK